MCMNVLVSVSIGWGQRIICWLLSSHPIESLNLSHSLSISLSLTLFVFFLFLTFPFIHSLGPDKLTFKLLIVSPFSLSSWQMLSLSVFLSLSHRHNREILTMYDLSTPCCYQCANKAIRMLPTPAEFIAENILNARGMIHFPVRQTAVLSRMIHCNW